MFWRYKNRGIIVLFIFRITRKGKAFTWHTPSKQGAGSAFILILKSTRTHKKQNFK